MTRENPTFKRVDITDPAALQQAITTNATTINGLLRFLELRTSDVCRLISGWTFGAGAQPLTDDDYDLMMCAVALVACELAQDARHEQHDRALRSN